MRAWLFYWAILLGIFRMALPATGECVCQDNIVIKKAINQGTPVVRCLPD